MNANASSGILDTCKCRISIRMEEKGGRNFRKLGFTDINLAEYAGVGLSTQRYILQPYDLNHRLVKSRESKGVATLQNQFVYTCKYPQQILLSCMYFSKLST